MPNRDAATVGLEAQGDKVASVSSTDGDPFGHHEDPDERQAGEAEELMRQGRFQDAASRYQDLRQDLPTDLWATLGHASALECAGQVHEAEAILEEAASRHRTSAHLLRFRRMFFVRREDFMRARACLSDIDGVRGLDGEPPDQLADLYFNQGRYHEALTELQRIQAEEEIDEAEIQASVAARMGACLRQDGQLDDASDQLEASLALAPDNSWTLSELAEVERARGRPDAARDRYQQALDVEPDDHWCRGHLAQLEYELGNETQATDLYRQVLAAEPQATWALVELAQVLTRSQPEESAALCREALELDPAYPWAWSQLGVLARERGDLEKARKHFQEAHAAAPDAIWILHELADTCHRMGRREEAATHLDHARALAPFDAATMGYTAHHLRSDGQDEAAISHLEKAVDLDPDYTWAWRELAELRANMGLHHEAKEAADHAAKLDPDDPVNLGLKAYLLRANGRHAEALAPLREATSAMPTYQWAWHELVEIELHLGQPHAAERSARAGLAQTGEHVGLRNLLVEALRRRGQLAEAVAELEAGLEHHPEQAGWWAQLAELVALEDLEDALPHAERAVALDDAPEHRTLLARIQAAHGDLSSARTTLTPALEHANPPPAAWLLAAKLAESDDPAKAARLLERGLSLNRRERRLLGQRLRLALEHDSLAMEHADQALEHLLADHSHPVNDLALPLANRGQRVAARRVAGRVFDQADTDQRAGATVLMAEVELALGDLVAAGELVNQALDHEPVPAQARILAAILAERSGDHQTACDQLEALVAWADSKQADPGELAALTRQLAQYHERAGNRDAADHHWQRARDIDPTPTSVIAELRETARRNDRERCRQLAGDVTTRLASESAAVQRRGHRDVAMALFHSLGPGPAADHLVANLEAPPSADDIALLANLELAAGRHADAKARIPELMAHGPEHAQAADRIMVRCHLARWDVMAADGPSLALTERDQAEPGDIVLRAEILALTGRHDDGVSLLADLPAQRPDAALLRCMIALEHEQPDAAIARLAGARLDPDLPLVQVLAAAWPNLISAGDRVAQPDDCRSLPPMPSAAIRIANALERLGKSDLASATRLSALTACRQAGKPFSVQWLLRETCAGHRRQGATRDGIRLAWQARSLGALWRCLFAPGKLPATP